ncbi:hypothetical protein WBQ28_15260 [Pseudomonas syringae pv. syringae]|uniref:hypothetical protein n=1 Tax=Pseudomonas syringae TaxID=317 RepID=UPI003B0007C1
MSDNFFKLRSGSIFVAGNLVELPYPVGDVKIVDDLIIVRVEPPAGEVFNRNVFGIAKSGELLWQIEESPHGTQDDKPFIDIAVNRDNKLVAGNWNGVAYHVDIGSGKISVDSFDK